MRGSRRPPMNLHASPVDAIALGRKRFAMSTRDILLQIGQVLTVLVLAPLIQGIILQFEERVQRGRGPGIFQPYRDLWKLFHKQIVVPETASWLFWVAPIVAFTCMLTVPILIPVLTNFPLPLSDMGDILGGGLILTLGSFMIILAGLDTSSAYGGIGSSRAVMVVDPGRADADPGLRRHHAARQGDAAVRRQSSAGGELGRLLEPGASLSRRGLLHPAAGRDRPHADPFEHAYRGLHDRGGPHPRIFRAAAGAPQMGVGDEAVHPLHDLLQRAGLALGAVDRGHGARRGRRRRWPHRQVRCSSPASSSSSRRRSRGCASTAIRSRSPRPSCWRSWRSSEPS